jgi:hypothetical protein
MEQSVNLTPYIIFSVIAILIAIAGWVYQLGRSDARLSRAEQDIVKLTSKLETIEKQRAEDEKEFRKELKDGFEKLYKKIDNLPCHNPNWNKKEDC